MKRVLTALVLIPLVLLAVFRAPDWLFTALVGVVAVLATIEYLQIAAKYGYKVYPVVSVGFVAVLFAAAAITRTRSAIPCGFACCQRVRRGDTRLNQRTGIPGRQVERGETAQTNFYRCRDYFLAQ